MSRRAHRNRQPSSALYADAYSYQQGEFYPEHHLANVQRLHQKYPEHSLSEIDEIYRQACRIDAHVQQRLGGSHLTEKAKQELLGWLEDHFFGFSRESFLRAIERAESL
jgi:hypothetical protein